MSDSRRRTVAFLGVVAGAVLVAALQVWSKSAATPLELVGRPLVVALLGAPILVGKSWGRWPLLIGGGTTAWWLLRSAATAVILEPVPRALVAIAGVVVAVCTALPWVKRSVARV